MAVNRQPGRLRVGTSGFNYPHWKGRFYPPDLPSARWLTYYAQHFTTVELNVTFYRLPGEQAFRRWAASVPHAFRFVLKGSRFITHIKRLKDCDEPLEALFRNAGPIGQQLDVVLWQLPPRFRADPERLETFLEQLDRWTFRHAFEFRDASWFEPSVLEVLRQHNAAVVMADWPFPDVDIQPTANWIYLRRHGPAPPYAGSYPDEILARDAQAIGAWLRCGMDVFCFFNNDVGGYAVEDARRLQALVGDVPGHLTHDPNSRGQVP
ncbi:MAG: DUF72 domain-containing protein [Bacillota bacterium]